MVTIDLAKGMMFMKPQNFHRKNFEIIQEFLELKKDGDFNESRSLNLSWSNWGFGIESFETSARRLEKFGVQYIELHGNRYGENLGYKAVETKKVLEDHNLKVSGLCGMVMPDSEFSSNNPFVRQRCIDYFKRNIELCKELGGSYILFSPGAVGRPQKYDDSEFQRAAETIRIVGDFFVESGIRGAIEPVRPEEVSICHTLGDAKDLINAIDHPGVRHICGDIFHMLAGESHIGEALINYGEMIINLHLADTNRRALGTGSMDMDMILMALYVVGYNQPNKYCTAEPLGTGANPYQSMYQLSNEEELDNLVSQTAAYFRDREAKILSATEDELRKLYGYY
ncbi:sugar phosphate isomerase/epimerase family protein [Alicyclobacillus dauci]|uniref:Sugar phosphate isomerase/epimerase n=1 Tax=Alicyclobacillus dauci TaxID=1475485 RepID=A0ABY6Z513_9BACL|nr:sugar phosphate isomerase/epimerase family protein [Alicyclobacillus dauci]WAH37973.1 sugar phosphate isomerase/epimerase [Alicyclobacillus dauci]